MISNEIPCEIWTRTVGYFRPVSEMNKGKQSEYNDRIVYKIPEEEK